jgi:hypothetical protein
MLEFKKDEKFEDLGSLDDFFNSYGDCDVSIEDIEKTNIQLTIVSNQQIEFKLVCSQALSNIIREENGFPFGMEKYRIYRICEPDGNCYIRISQSIMIEYNSSNDSEMENKLKGHIRYIFRV